MAVLCAERSGSQRPVECQAPPAAGMPAKPAGSVPLRLCIGLVIVSAPTTKRWRQDGDGERLRGREKIRVTGQRARLGSY
jgi:hypothetical protein